MPENRYFVDTDMHKGQTLELPPQERKHLRVMRKQPGDQIELVNGRHLLAQATLTPAYRACIDTIHVEPIPKRTIIVALSLLKPKSLDWVVEKGTELGASSFWLFAAEKGDKKGLSESQKKRLRHLTIAALKQCGRLDLPAIELKPPPAQWGPLPHPLFFGDLGAPCFLKHCGSAILAIGPESGWTQYEREALKALGGTPIRLNNNTLRAETAAICALANITASSKW